MASRMTMIFVDSSFWISIISRRETWHEAARALLECHAGSTLITSTDVRGETWTFLRYRYGYGPAVAFLDRLASASNARVAFVDEHLQSEAIQWLRGRDERPYSFVDATSFALMRSLGIQEALAFDGDFAAAGFVELRPE
jgi:predicted nucleic acid-binding protein